MIAIGFVLVFKAQLSGAKFYEPILASPSFNTATNFKAHKVFLAPVFKFAIGHESLQKGNYVTFWRLEHRSFMCAKSTQRRQAEVTA